MGYTLVEDENAYGNRPDGTKKGRGFLGEIRTPKGDVMTEYSIGVNLDGKEVDIPTLVPTLTKQEIDFLKTQPSPAKIPKSIMNKAIDHAVSRMRKGQSPFYTEEPKKKASSGYTLVDEPEYRGTSEYGTIESYDPDSEQPDFSAMGIEGEKLKSFLKSGKPAPTSEISTITGKPTGRKFEAPRTPVPAKTIAERGEKLEDYPLRARVADAITPTLKIGGGILGGILAAPESFGTASVPGAALGYGAGGQLGRIIRGDYKGAKRELINAAKDVAEGAATEMVGQSISPALAPVKKYLSGKAKSASRSIAESVMKVPPSVKDDIRQRAIDTMLAGEYGVSTKGLEKLRSDITKTNESISNMISMSKQSGEKIKTKDILSRLDELKKYYSDLPNPTSQLKEIESIRKGVERYRGKEIPIDAAQRMKQRIYQAVKYAETKPIGGHADSPVKIKADKYMARGLKEEIVNKIPELKYLNEKDSALISLEKYLERAVNRTSNYDIMRLGDSAATAAGGAVAGGPGAAAVGFFKTILGFPDAKSKIAFALNRAAQKSGKNELKRRFTAAMIDQTIIDDIAQRYADKISGTGKKRRQSEGETKE